jgi:ABC-type multidrug transport system ATPase subunit
MNIILDRAGKKFNSEWIFKNVSLTFEQGRSYAILGKNGSGKSTLLQVISGKIHPTAGTISYHDQSGTFNADHFFRYIAMSAPYLELIEDFTLTEMLRFHFSFKKILPGYSINDILSITGLQQAASKPIRLYSSGMKQRVKLVLAFFSDVPILMLDEPTTNLDQAGTDWYLDLVNKFAGNRLMIICSNLEKTETGFCREKILIEHYK